MATVAEAKPVFGTEELGVFKMGPLVQLFGHVILVQSFSTGTGDGAYCLVDLRDSPETVAVMTTKLQLQCTMETGLATGNLVTFTGRKYNNPPTPLGGSWSVDVYAPKSFAIYNFEGTY